MFLVVRFRVNDVRHPNEHPPRRILRFRVIRRPIRVTPPPEVLECPWYGSGRITRGQNTDSCPTAVLCALSGRYRVLSTAETAATHFSSDPDRFFPFHSETTGRGGKSFLTNPSNAKLVCNSYRFVCDFTLNSIRSENPVVDNTFVTSKRDRLRT